MSCPNETSLVKLLGGELPEAEAQAIQQHLAACDVCAARLREMREVWDRLDAWHVEPPGDPLVGRVLAAAAVSPRRSRVPLLRLAAGILLAIAGGIIAAGFVPPGPPATAQAEPLSDEVVAESIGLDLWSGDDMVFTSLLDDPHPADQEPS